MPTIESSMPARRATHGPDPKYDWPSIFDGRVHRFGVDELPSTPRNFARQVRRAASVRGLNVQIIVRAGIGVFVQRRVE